MGRDETTKTRTRAPGLDGVRALAVLAVMGFHEGASELSGGFLGVDIFFVLSGFLITDLLARQYDLLGRVDLKGFWTRRARRLLPPLAVMLVIVTAAATVIEPAQERSLRLALLAAATYTSNWYQIFHHVSYFEALGPMPPLDHLWSLAIEEQFYLIWPLILWFAILRLKDRRARVAVTLAGAAISALAMALQYTPGGDPSAVYYGTDTHASALLIGAALALACPLARLESTPAEQSRQLDAMGIAGLAFLAWALGHFSGSDPAVYPLGLILAALAAAGLVAAAASNGVIAAMASLPPLRWVGIRSYAIYLWHWPVIALGGALVGQGPTTPGLWVIEAGVTVALAAASWRFIETPIMAERFPRHGPPLGPADAGRGPPVRRDAQAGHPPDGGRDGGHCRHHRQLSASRARRHRWPRPACSGRSPRVSRSVPPPSPNTRRRPRGSRRARPGRSRRRSPAGRSPRSVTR